MEGWGGVPVERDVELIFVMVLERRHQKVHHDMPACSARELRVRTAPYAGAQEKAWQARL